MTVVAKELSVARGQIFGVPGHSGAGKSTLLRCVNLLERPDAGTVVVDGVELTGPKRQPLRAARRRVGMVHQHFALLASRTAAGNVAFPLEVTGVPRTERARRVAELLDLVGLSERANAYPAQLSGGQKQRVGIARALAAGPQVLLSDEATSALDPETTRSILDLLRELNERLGLTILLITHETDVVKRICHGAAVMRDGRFTESGPVADLLRRPGSEPAHGLFPLPPAEPRPGAQPAGQERAHHAQARGRRQGDREGHRHQPREATRGWPSWRSCCTRPWSASSSPTSTRVRCRRPSECRTHAAECQGCVALPVLTLPTRAAGCRAIWLSPRSGAPASCSSRSASVSCIRCG
ncbi:hypothetical protein GCM10022629_30220 [Amorphoplanes auranticolor]